MNILIISPHIDDEIIGCGGTIAKHKSVGDDISIVYIYKCWSGIPEKNKIEAEKIRKKEAGKSAKILGISQQYFLRQEDRSFSLNNNIIQRLVKIIRKANPEIIYLPHSQEKDREHKLTYEAAKEAIWLANSLYLKNLGKQPTKIKYLYLYEVWTPMDKYDIKNDINKFIKKKILAIKEQKSQLKYFDLIDASLGLNMYRGSLDEPKKGYAEVFLEKKI